MDNDNKIIVATENFAVRIVRLYKVLCERDNTYELYRQLLRSGTSIGANTSEAVCGTSRPDFLAKMYIAFKECNETRYWLRLLNRAELLSDKEYESMYNDSEAIYKMLSSITKTTRASLKKN